MYLRDSYKTGKANYTALNQFIFEIPHDIEQVHESRKDDGDKYVHEQY